MKPPFFSLSCPQHKIIDLCLPIRISLIAGLVLLPFSHLRWLPNLGTTRPISSILFVFSLGLIVINYFILSVHRSDFSISKLFSLRYIRLQLQVIPGWQIIIPWIILILMGIISAAIYTLLWEFPPGVKPLARIRYHFRHIILWIICSKTFRNTQNRHLD